MPKECAGRDGGESADVDPDFLRRSSIVMLECAVSLMMTCMSPDDVVEVLATEIEMLTGDQ